MPFCRHPYETEESNLEVTGNTLTWTFTPNTACDIHVELNSTCAPNWPANKDCQTDVFVDDVELEAHEPYSVTLEDLPRCYQFDAAYDNHDGVFRMIDTIATGQEPCVLVPRPTTTVPIEHSTTTTTPAQSVCIVFETQECPPPKTTKVETSSTVYTPPPVVPQSELAFTGSADLALMGAVGIASLWAGFKARKRGLADR
jgi:hypothetical protein